MKKYERIALVVGVAGLGFVAYQTWMQKQAVDSNETIDPNRSPITGAKNAIGGAVQNGKNFIGGLLHKGSDGANEVKNKIYSGTLGLFQAGTNSVDFVKDTGQNGLKYIYNKGADTGNALRESTGWFFTKSKNAMGNTYETARTYIPNALISVGGLTGIFHAAKNEKAIGEPIPPSENKTGSWINSFIHPMGGRSKASNDLIANPQCSGGICIT